MYEYRGLTPQQRAELVRQRLARGFPSHSPPHPVRKHPYYLVTAACYEHVCHMVLPDRRRLILDALSEHLTTHRMAILAWVVLPNHYHVLAHVPDFDALGGTLRRVHGPTSRQWNLEDATPGRKVWYLFTDRAVRSERHYYTTLNYIHYNPIKHRWAHSPYDWAESSVHWYLEQFGREWLRDLWTRYPIRDYGRGWDDMSAVEGR